ncbi:hypothetical protein [Elstera sp.]|uniref:hypothetical protein n=1 Tax=Elstera sp. TaxID=1916664 RepID=UPI0037C038CC
MRAALRMVGLGLLWSLGLAAPSLAQSVPNITLEQMIGTGPNRGALEISNTGYVPRTPDDPKLANAIATLDGQARTDLDRKLLANLYALRAQTYRLKEVDKAEADFDTSLRIISGNDPRTLQPARDDLIQRKALYLSNLGGTATDKAIGLYRQVFDAFDPASLAAYQSYALENQALQIYARTAITLTELSFAQGRPDEARAWVQQTLAKIGPLPSPLAREQLLAVLYSFGAGLAARGPAEQAEALTVFDQVLARGKTALSGDRYQWLAQSLMAKGLLLRQMGRRDEAAAVEAELIDTYNDDTDLVVARAVLVTKFTQTKEKAASYASPRALADAYEALAAEYEPKLQRPRSIVNSPAAPLALAIAEIRLQQTATLGTLLPPPLQEIIRVGRSAVDLTKGASGPTTLPLLLSGYFTLANAYGATGPLGAAPALQQLDHMAEALEGRDGPMPDRFKLIELLLRRNVITQWLPGETQQLEAIAQEAQARFGASEDPQIRQFLGLLNPAQYPRKP